MSSLSPTEAARKLVQVFSGISSTEGLILYVASTDGMLSFCQELLEQNDRDNQAPLPLEVNALCAAQGILPGLLYAEIRKVLIALNRFHNAGYDHYATLGLQADASIEEVKRSYRRLSKNYHPDTAADKDEATQRFMEITGAYHAIMTTLTDTELPAHEQPWRKKGRDLKTRGMFYRKSFFLTLMLLILVLIGISFYLSKKYNEHIIFSQFTKPPPSEIHNPAPSQAVRSLPPAPTLPPAELLVQETPPENGPDTAGSISQPQPEEPVASSPPGDADTVPADPRPENNGLAAQDLHHPEKVEPEKADKLESAVVVVKPQISEKKNPVHNIARIAADKEHSIPPRKQVGHKSIQDLKTSPAAPTPPDRDDLEQAIGKVLDQYTELYCAKDLEHFLELFDKDARENGQLQAQLIDRYKSLFAHTEAIDLNLKDLNWNEIEQGFEAKCEFTANYTYKDGHRKEHNGDITFYLTSEQGNLKIQSLDYVFWN